MSMLQDRVHMSHIGRNIVVAVLLTACVRSQDSMVALSDRVEEQAQALEKSVAQTLNLSYSFEASPSWMLVLVPKAGFDERQAADKGMNNELRSEVARRAKAWGASSLIVFISEWGTSVTKVSALVDVRDQIILQGDYRDVRLDLGLSKAGSGISIISASARGQ